MADDINLRTTKDPCVSCNAKLVKQNDWAQARRSTYTTLREMGYAKYGAHGMCDTCYARARRAEAHSNDTPAPQVVNGCTECIRTLIPKRAWNALPDTARHALTAAGFAKQATNTRCTACYVYEHRHTHTVRARAA